MATIHLILTFLISAFAIPAQDDSITKWEKSIVALEKLVSPGAQRIFTRFMGLILVAMGFQFVMHGVKDFFFPA